ncbi:MAG: fructose-1,6-bisphosphate aldolase/phosphatase [Patescibacteria group bacterium]|nr:MAG: fructose-1,6-bisphosphate aldolase/phosphatase [Patescibacteria group bacterium]
MKITVSTIKADVGSIAGHTAPHPAMLSAVERLLLNARESGLLLDAYLTFIGDDINILMTHTKGANDGDIHGLAWDSFMSATEIAKELGLYGAGQDILKDTYSGNIKGMGPGVAEMEFEERPAECLVLLMADKTEPSALSPIFFHAFCNPFHSHGMLLSKPLFAGFTVVLFDTKTGQRGIFSVPEENRLILTLTAYNSHRFVFEAGRLSGYGEPAFAAVTDRLHNIAGRYVGKDDPAALVRTQKIFPATEELLPILQKAQLVGGDARGSHYMPLMPVAAQTPAAANHCIPMIAALGFSLKNGELTMPIDLLGGADFDEARRKAVRISEYMWDHGPFSPFMLPPDELEYGDVAGSVNSILEERFR